MQIFGRPEKSPTCHMVWVHFCEGKDIDDPNLKSLVSFKLSEDSVIDLVSTTQRIWKVNDRPGVVDIYVERIDP